MTLDVAPPAQTADFDALYRKYHAPIFNHVCRLMGNYAQAEELTQDAFLKVWLALQTGRYREVGNLQAWIYRVATNVCLDELRHQKLVKLETWDTFTHWLLRVPRHQISKVGRFSTEDHATESILRREQVESLQGALRKLPHHYAAALVLFECNDFSYDEIAVAFNTSRTAIKSLLFRARNLLAEVMGVERVLRPNGRWRREVYA